MEPKLWKPQYYPVTIDVPTTQNTSAQASEKINAEPFLLKLVTHQILGATLNVQAPPGPGVIYQDGQYLIFFEDERTHWQKSSMVADAAFGSVRHGRWIPLQAPIAFRGNQNIRIQVVNLTDRTASELDFFKVQIVLIGVENLPVETSAEAG
ncbi:MAG: hypothetical protein QNJ97_25165 [Myxococcota bacterium]|nr:hypothetical protein [Myxococcota bacterium]